MRVSVANVAMPSVMKTGITRMAADQHNTVLWQPNDKKTNPGTQHPGGIFEYPGLDIRDISIFCLYSRGFC